MNCTRCHRTHTPDYSLTVTEHGLLCPVCLNLLPEPAAQGRTVSINIVWQHPNKPEIIAGEISTPGYFSCGEETQV